MLGAGNIGRDDTVYADGAITREGTAGESTASEFSTGRGGVGNMGKSPRLGPQDIGALQGEAWRTQQGSRPGSWRQDQASASP